VSGRAKTQFSEVYVLLLSFGFVAALPDEIKVFPEQEEIH